MSSNTYLSKLILVVVFFTSLANGGALWLKKVGWINSGEYQQISDQKTQIDESLKSVMDGFFSLSVEERTEILASPTMLPVIEEIKHYKKRIFALQVNTNKYVKFSTLLNDVFLISFLFLSFFALSKQSIRRNFLYLLNTYTSSQALLLLLVIMFAVTWSHFGILFSLAGLYSLAFILVFFFCSWFSTESNLKLLAGMFILFIFVQFILSPIEYKYGVSFYRRGDLLTNRIAGTMQQPSTLGVTAAIAFTFYSRYAEQTFLRIAAIIVTILVVLSGSGTAYIILTISGLIILLEKSINKRGFAFWFTIFSALSIILFSISEFWEFWVQSLSGRIEKYTWYFDLDLPLINYLFGSGLGNGSNVAIQIAPYLTLNSTELFPILRSSDSTPLVLIMQIGVVGCGLVYWIVLHAAWVDREMRVVYVAFIFASLTTNVIEIYPLNLLLGLILARSLLLPMHLDLNRRQPRGIQPKKDLKLQPGI